MKTHDLFKPLFNSMHDHVKLLEAGVPNDQALRIAFGDDVAERAIDQTNDILTEQNEEVIKQKLKDFWT